MADEAYQRRTSLYHAALALAALLAAGWAWWSGGVSPALGLVLSGVTNALIAAEKYRLLRRGCP